MKLWFFTVLSFFAVNNISCQSVDKSGVPEEVQESFAERYPGEKDPDWRKDRNGNFESHFKRKGRHYRADYSPDGVWIETERSIKKDDLPKAVKNELKKNFDSYEIVEIEEVDHPSKGLFYDVELKKDGEKKDVEFTTEGKIIN